VNRTESTSQNRRKCSFPSLVNLAVGMCSQLKSIAGQEPVEVQVAGQELAGVQVAGQELAGVQVAGQELVGVQVAGQGLLEAARNRA
jgi:hypothetical protein